MHEMPRRIPRVLPDPIQRANRLATMKRIWAFIAYLGNDARRRESEHRILHTAIWEAWWENQDIVLTPRIGVDNFLEAGKR